MSQDMILQEYYTSFDMGVEGAYYSYYMDGLYRNGNIACVPWESAFPVHTAWDIGMHDNTCVIFFQTIGQTIRLIDSYQHSKEGLEHYAKILQQKPYQYGKHIAPHDIRVKEWGSGITRYEKARQLGITFTVADQYEIADGIEACRSLFSKLWIDEEKCKELIKSLENYRQEYNLKKRVYIPRPLHDWSSHFADAFRYLAVSLSKTSDGLSAKDIERQFEEAHYGSQSHLPPMFQEKTYHTVY